METPDRGFVFWPVSNGDSTTIFVEKDVVVQVDLHHMACADDDDDPNTPVIDELVAILPKVDKKTPYLAAFALTHHDDDHCCGFSDLLKKVMIGELWFTPQIFIEEKGDLCDEAKAFRKEALRRVKATIDAGGKAKAGDRVRIVGWDDILNNSEYKGFPKSRLIVPGNTFTDIDGQEYNGRFRAFVHAPFKEDLGGARNDSSLGLQITLIDGAAIGQAMLLGDLCYTTVNRIFKKSHAADVAWNIFLAPHHCSKSVMYAKAEGDKEETLKRDLLNAIENAAQSPGYIVASSVPIPSTNQPGDDPPHAKAKARYEEIVPDEFICTMEYPNTIQPQAIVFDFTSDGLTLREPTEEMTKSGGISLSAIAVGVIAAAGGLAVAIAAARGSAEPPKDRVGFGGSELE
jgi:hypothetical protein